MGSNPKNLIIRADANSQIGSGHVMRCLALAQAWQEMGGQVTFIITEADPLSTEKLRTEGIPWINLAVEPGSLKDAAQTAEVGCQCGTEWAAVDSYACGTEYQRTLKTAGLRILFVDDYGHAKRYVADLVLNQNIFTDEALYIDREPQTQLLLGTRYVLLRREFWLWKGCRPKIPEIARKVLVTMGGSDPDNVTQKIMKALALVDVEGLESIIVVGGNNARFRKLEYAAHNSFRKIRLVHNVNNMVELIEWADVAITAGGSTCWELAFLGVPSLITILADNQVPVARGLDLQGASINLGWHTTLNTKDVASRLHELLFSSEKREKMANQGQLLVDGNGAIRVARKMSRETLALRYVREEDCRLIWEWANEPLTRAQSFSPEPISWDEHRAWFDSIRNDPSSRLYVALDTNGEPVGQIRFRIEGEEAVISISLAPEHRGHGYGAGVISLGSQELWKTKTIRLIHAYIKPENIASIRAFIKAGFVESGTTKIKNSPALRFTLGRTLQHDIDPS